MDRRTLLAAVGTTPTVALTGCVGVLGDVPGGCRASGFGGSRTPDAATVVGHFDGDPTRPECVRDSETIEIERNGTTETFETAGTIPYPEPPTSFACEAVVDYVEAFDQAYVTHDELCDWQSPPYALGVGDTVLERGTYTWYDDIAIVVLVREVGISSFVSEDGDLATASAEHEGVVYAIDETGAARATTPIHGGDARTTAEFESRASEPLDEGTLVAVFQ